MFLLFYSHVSNNLFKDPFAYTGQQNRALGFGFSIFLNGIKNCSIVILLGTRVYISSPHFFSIRSKFFVSAINHFVPNFEDLYFIYRSHIKNTHKVKMSEEYLGYRKLFFQKANKK